MGFVILGEGEVTWKEFVDEWTGSRNFYDVKGLAFLDNDKYVCNPMRPIADLRKFPEMDWSVVKPQKYFLLFFIVRKCSFCMRQKVALHHVRFARTNSFIKARTDAEIQNILCMI